MGQPRDETPARARGVNDHGRTYSVSEITGALKRTLETAYDRVRVRGEITNLRRPASGHLYFALKDDRAQLRSVMFRGDAVGLRFLPADGLEVEAEGEISVYEPRGDLQLLARRMAPSGVGALMQAFEALKRRLSAEGLFDPARKRPLPPFPRVIGIVTSPTGAAIRDLLHVLSRRWPASTVVFHPTLVQGEGAASDIARAIDRMSRWGGADVVIVGRGGGSLEDLWAFNEEEVARAIASCSVPVVSAVGHEIDLTISDLVADVKAATPSAAAEIVAPDRNEVAVRFRTLGSKLHRIMVNDLETHRLHLQRLAGAYGFRKPESFLRREAQRLDELVVRLSRGASAALGKRKDRCLESARRLALHHPIGLLKAAHARLSAWDNRLGKTMETGLLARRSRVTGVSGALRALNPAGVLGRGYCLARDPETHRVLSSASGLAPGAPVVVQFLKDRAHGLIERTETGGPHELEALEAVQEGSHDGEEEGQDPR